MKINLVTMKAFAVNYIRIIFLQLLNLFLVFTAFSQKLPRDYTLKRSFKQEGLQYQFTVLGDVEKGIRQYDTDKFYYWFKAQKVMATQGASSGQLLNGLFEAFHENKQLASRGSFRKGLKNGKWMYWRNDGILIRMEKWKDGTLTGKAEDYNEQGKLQAKIRYKKRKVIKSYSDSLVTSYLRQSKKVILLKDSTGRFRDKYVYKNGELVESTPKRKNKEQEQVTMKDQKQEKKGIFRNKKEAEKQPGTKKTPEENVPKGSGEKSKKVIPAEKKQGNETEQGKTAWWKRLFKKKDQNEGQEK